MLPCLFIPAVILADTEWLSIPTALTTVDFPLDRVTLRLAEVEQGDHAVVEAAHKQHLPVHFDYHRVAARRLALNVLQREQLVWALTLLRAQHLLRREDLSFAIHGVVGEHACRGDKSLSVLPVGKLLERADYATISLHLEEVSLRLAT